MKTKTSIWPKVGLLFLFYWSILLWEACGATVVDSCGNNGCPEVELLKSDGTLLKINTQPITWE